MEKSRDKTHKIVFYAVWIVTFLVGVALAWLRGSPLVAVVFAIVGAPMGLLIANFVAGKETP